MVVDHACACYHLVIIGVEAPIVAIYAQSLCCGYIFFGVKHVEMFVHLLKSDVPLIRYLEPPASSLFCFYFYYTRRTAWAVHGSFGGILQNFEALDVGRIDGWKCKYVGSDAINQHQWVVASNDRGGATHTHTVEHGHSVKSVGGYVDTGSLAAQYIKGVVNTSPWGVAVRHLYNSVPVFYGILLFCWRLLLCMSQRTAKECNGKERKFFFTLCHLVYLFIWLLMNL